MTSHYRHRRIFDPAAAFPTLIEPGEIAVNTANRQLAVGDANPGSAGSQIPLLAVRLFDVRSQYAVNDYVVQAGNFYRAKVSITPAAFNASQWDAYITADDAKGYVDAGDAAITADYQAADVALADDIATKLDKGGDSMTGYLTLVGIPNQPLHAATKQYVDQTVAAGGLVTLPALSITVAPGGGIQSTNVQDALYELDIEKAPLASPLFSGDPRASTPPVDDNDVSIATTAFVAGQASTALPLVAGVAVAGSSIRFAREDHVHPKDTSLAPVDSPAFTGNPTAPTPAPGDNDTSIATTAYVQSTLVGVSGFSTGDVKLTLKKTADAGWVMMNDGTIGDVGSGGTTRANHDVQALFELLWNNITDVYCPVSGGRGTSSGGDWLAKKTITLSRALGRTLAIAGNGAGLSGRALGEFAGEETHALIAAEGANMPVAVSSLSVSVSGGVTIPAGQAVTDATSGGSQSYLGDGSNPITTGVATTKNAFSGSFSGGGSGSGSGATTGGGTPHNNIQPSSFLNAMVKL